MKSISDPRRFLILSAFLCALLPAQLPAQRSTLSFTLETKEKAVPFFEPLVVRVVLHNSSSSPISIDTKSLRLIADSWHVVGTWGQWSGGEGEPLEPEDRPGGRVELPARGSLRLLAVHKNPSFELLGPVRVGYTLSSTDAVTKKLLPNRPREVRFDALPTEVMTAVWAAGNQSQREMAQPIFNEFLKFRAAIEAAKDSEGGDFQKRLADQAFAIKSLYYLAGYALPFLHHAVRDKDPFIREQAVLAYFQAAGAIDQFDAYLTDLDKYGPRPRWALALKKGHNRDLADSRAFALRALSDPAPNVRVAGITVLGKKYWDEDNFFSTSIGYPKSDPDEQPDNTRDTSREVNAIKALSKDPDASVRAAVQTYLASFADENAAADTVADALTDSDATVRKNALDALLRSAQAPPLDTIKRAFVQAKGDTALGLIPLLLEQEEPTLSSTLGKDFARRSEAERLAIMTAIAGHNDTATVELIKSGLSDSSSIIQRAALMRLLAVPRDASMPLIENYLRGPAQLKPLAEAVKAEIETRSLWPFLKTVSANQTSASESIFPSRNGQTPMTSPDGQWIAYVETGWGRPGGSGGLGSSNLLTITHVVGTNGQNDRVVSDMSLRSWMSDSKRVGTSRDAFVAITDFDGNVLGEFGDLLAERYRDTYKPGADWTRTDLRTQFGGSMPHQKRIEGTEDFGFAGTFSPDGRLFGPLQDQKGVFFLGVDDQRLPVKMELPQRAGPAMWSPDGRYVQVSNDSEWLIIDMQSLSSHKIANIDDYYFEGNSPNPWSRDGRRLTFVRNGQVWVSDAHGNDAKQLTFDSTRKASPTFSRDGRSVAYITWQPDNRRHYPRLGPTDVWVVDVSSTLATRVTAPGKGRINSFDWLDGQTLILDRLEEEEEKSFRPAPRSSLRRVSLASPKD